MHAIIRLCPEIYFAFSVSFHPVVKPSRSSIHSCSPRVQQYRCVCRRWRYYRSSVYPLDHQGLRNTLSLWQVLHGRCLFQEMKAIQLFWIADIIQVHLKIGFLGLLSGDFKFIKSELQVGWTTAILAGLLQDCVNIHGLKVRDRFC